MIIVITDNISIIKYHNTIFPYHNWSERLRYLMENKDWIGLVLAPKTGYPERFWHSKLATRKSIGPKTGYPERYWHSNLATGKREYRQQNSFPGSQFWVPEPFRVASFQCQYFSGQPVFSAKTFPGSQFSVPYQFQEFWFFLI